MPRFSAIEGARAWLAWAVVFSHIAQTLGLGIHGGPGRWFEAAGEAAVLVFIAISGFVIAGLVIDKHEPWPRYITRRAFRIFPAYWIAYAAALVALPYGVTAASSLGWSADPAYDFDDLLRGWQQAIADRPVAQIALHAALLQGVVPDSLWPHTSAAALGPAWSLSLEWQFYLLAPAIVWLLATPRTRLAAVICILLLAVAFQAHLFGDYWLKSFLPGAGYIFMIGIASRLGFERLKALPVGPEFVPFALLFGLVAPPLMWLAIWAALVVYLARAEQWRAGANGRRIVTTLDAMLASRIARYLGERSYSVYLVHLPVIMGVSWAISRETQPGKPVFALLLAAIVVPAVLLVSEITYRLVERPMIALGARLARQKHAAPAAAAE